MTRSQPARCLAAVLALGALLLSPPEATAKATVEETSIATSGGQASAAIETLEFVDAADAFDQVLARTAPPALLWQQATFGKALAMQHITPPSESYIDQAVGLYKQLLEKTPDSKFAPLATLSLGRIAEVRDFPGDASDLDAARTHYQRVLDQWPDTNFAHEAAIRIAGLSLQQIDDPQAMRAGVAYLQAYLAQHPDNRYASIMYEQIGQTYDLAFDEYGPATEAYMKALRIGLLTQAELPQVLWRVAQLAERAGRPADAAYCYQQILTGALRSGRSFEARLALKRLAARHPELHIEVPDMPRLEPATPQEEFEQRTAEQAPPEKPTP